MINEVNHREPRGIRQSQEVGDFPLWSSRVGSHSTSKKWRKTDLDILGPGIILYLKMLKYFGLCFFLFFLISIPSMWIYHRGHQYDDHPVAI